MDGVDREVFSEPENATVMNATRRWLTEASRSLFAVVTSIGWTSKIFLVESLKFEEWDSLHVRMLRIPSSAAGHEMVFGSGFDGDCWVCVVVIFWCSDAFWGVFFRWGLLRGTVFGCAKGFEIVAFCVSTTVMGSECEKAGRVEAGNEADKRKEMKGCIARCSLAAMKAGLQ